MYSATAGVVTPLDRELGDLIGSAGPVGPKLFTYVRYNAELTEEGLAAIGCGHIAPDAVRKLDAIDAIPDLREVGREVAEDGECRALRRVPFGLRGRRAHCGMVASDICA